MPDNLCPHFGTCGGCSLQHLSPPDYKAHKLAALQDVLQRHGLALPMRPMVQVPAGTRRRITLVAKHTRKGPQLGFHTAKSHDVVDVQTCLIARPELVKLLPPLRTLLAGWVKKAGALDLTLTLYPNGTDILFTGPEPDVLARQNLAAAAASLGLIRLSWRKEERQTSEPLYLAEAPVLAFGPVPVSPPPGAFLQPSAEGEALLSALVQEALGLGEGPVLDLFAGCGSFGFRLSAQRPVTLVEGDREAVAAATRAASRVKNVAVERRDLFRDELSGAELNKFAAVVLDPPRAGAKAQADVLAGCKVPLIAYVSCNPDTFARDALQLLAGGYKCQWVQPVDQFIWSAHLELVARFSRAEA